MGNCCDNKIIYDYKTNPSEIQVRDIISKIKLSKYNAKELEEILNKTYKQKFKMQKKFFIPLMESHFYEIDRKNTLNEIHEKIFMLLVQEIRDIKSKEEILIKAFPLLRKTFTSEEMDFSQLIFKHLGKEIAYRDLKALLFEIFEFYSFKINKLTIFSSGENIQLCREIYKLNEEFFSYDSILKSVEHLLRPLKKEGLKEKNIYIKRHEIHLIFTDIDTLSFESIRDYIISCKLNFFEKGK